MWINTASGEIVTYEQLVKEYETMKDFAGDFVDYIASRKVENGGNLEDYPLPF